MTERQQLFQDLVENFMGMYKGILRQHTSAEVLPYGQKAALFTVAKHETLNVKELACILCVTSGAVTQHVEALVQAGLVVREADPDDRRIVTLKLTEAGKKLISKLKQQRLKMMEELFVDVGDAEIAAFVNIAGRISRKIQNKEETKNV